MNERDFFARDIATPERFEKYLKVVVNGPSVESPPRSPKRHPQRFKDDGAFEFAFDPDTIDSEEVHENILKIASFLRKLQWSKNLCDFLGQSR